MPYKNPADQRARNQRYWKINKEALTKKRRRAGDLVFLAQKKDRYHNDPVFRLKVLARATVNNAIAQGALVRLPCEVCGKTQTVHGHHDDYNKPLEVRWLCREHHFEAHTSMSAPPNSRAAPLP
jgi:ribosomal protein S27AE